MYQKTLPHGERLFTAILPPQNKIMSKNLPVKKISASTSPYPQ